jgi:hypothetical protein
MCCSTPVSVTNFDSCDEQQMHKPGGTPATSRNQ